MADGHVPVCAAFDLSTGSSQITRPSDVSIRVWDQDGRIDRHIEISFRQLDPPEGFAVRVARTRDEARGESRVFVGWLGLFAVLRSLVFDCVDQPPP